MKDDFSVYLASTSDLDELLLIQEQTQETEWTPAQFLEYIENEQCWLAMVDDAIAGFAIFSHVVDEAELLNIAVNPAFQRQGIALRLFKEVARELKKARISQCFLEVATLNHKAQGLYQKLGFVEVGIRKNYYQRKNGTIDDAIVMRASL